MIGLLAWRYANEGWVKGGRRGGVGGRERNREKKREREGGRRWVGSGREVGVGVGVGELGDKNKKSPSISRRYKWS